MDSWFLLFLSLSIPLALSLLLFKHLNKNNKKLHLPPGPPSILFLIKFFYQRRSIFDIEPLLKQFTEKYGPIISLRIGTHPLIFISDKRIAHLALIQGGVTYSHRAKQHEPGKMFTNNGRDISSANYGPYWRMLRRNMSAEIMQPACIELFEPARRWALQILIKDLGDQAKTKGGIVVAMESFKYAAFNLLVFMCFGEKLDKSSLQEIQEIQYSILTPFTEFPIFGFFPSITKLIFKKKWNNFVAIRKKQEEIFLRLIRDHNEQKSSLISYADTLLNLKLPEENDRSLTNGDIVSICSEFLNGGTDTTATSLEWIMAELVKNPNIQAKVFDEIKNLTANDKTETEFITEEELKSLPYLKAVVLEGLRRHPPAHFLLPHTATEDTELEGYLIPKGADVNFMIAQIGWDERRWEDPLEFKPERFLEGEREEVDLTGTKEITMMPFGVGRRMCPGYLLAFLHLEYFVANLVREFEWKPVQEEEIDLTERLDFTVVMKNSFRATIVPRR